MSARWPTRLRADLFFASIGLRTNALLLDTQLIWFTIAICVVAILSKVLGSGLGARLGGATSRELLQIGLGMISRGEVGSIAATVGISNGIISAELFAVTVVMVLVTTLATPLLLRRAFRAPRPAEAQQPAAPTPAE